MLSRCRINIRSKVRILPYPLDVSQINKVIGQWENSKLIYGFMGDRLIGRATAFGAVP